MLAGLVTINAIGHPALSMLPYHVPLGCGFVDCGVTTDLTGVVVGTVDKRLGKESHHIWQLLTYKANTEQF